MTHGTKQRCKHDDTADRYACTTYISISHKKHTKWLRERDLQLQLHALSLFASCRLANCADSFLDMERQMDELAVGKIELNVDS